LLGHYTVNQVMPFLLLLPVTSVFGGIFFLGESLTTKIALGGCLAIIGVAMITIQRMPFRQQVLKDERNIRHD
jgi:O-acetylserine/cysteine efflux transporter